MKKSFWNILLCLALALSLVPTFTPDSRAVAILYDGDCGEDMRWELSDDGTLWIYGDGAMTNYAENTPTPWENICGEIKAVVIGNGVEHIGSSAFQGCDNLTALTAAYDTLTSIGAYAFASCALRDVKLPDSVTSIGNDAFYNCKQLQTVRLSANLTRVATSLFRGCTALSEIEIPEGVTEIGEQAFDGCAALAATGLPVSVTSVDKNAFNGCDALGKVYYGGTDWSKITIDDGNAPLKNAKRYRTYSGACGVNGNNLTWVLSRGTLTISGKGAMMDYAEKDKHAPWYSRAWFDIDDVVVEDGVTHIGAYAFDDCGSINVDLPDSVTSFGKNVLYTSWPHIYYHGSEADRKNIEGINTKENRDLVNAHWYYNCGRGTCGETLTWTFRDGTLEISGRGEMSCGSPMPWSEYSDGVTTLVIGKGVTKIEGNAFKNCDNLAYVTLPRSLRSIGAEAFGGSDTAFQAVYYGGDEVDREALNIPPRLNDRLLSALWYYCSEGPASLGTSYSIYSSSLMYHVTNAPKGALLIAAHYDKNGKLDFLQVVEPKYAEEESKIEVPCNEPGTYYKLMLVDGRTFAPLCKASSAYVDDEWDG
jgi:hypothetical protein